MLNQEMFKKFTQDDNDDKDDENKEIWVSMSEINPVLTCFLCKGIFQYRFYLLTLQFKLV